MGQNNGEKWSYFQWQLGQQMAKAKCCFHPHWKALKSSGTHWCIFLFIYYWKLGHFKLLSESQQKSSLSFHSTTSIKRVMLSSCSKFYLLAFLLGKQYGGYRITAQHVACLTHLCLLIIHVLFFVPNWKRDCIVKMAQNWACLADSVFFAYRCW